MASRTDGQGGLTDQETLQSRLQHLASREAVGGQLDNLKETIAKPLALTASLLKGDLGDELSDEVSAWLDSGCDVACH